MSNGERLLPVPHRVGFIVDDAVDRGTTGRHGVVLSLPRLVVKHR